MSSVYAVVPEGTPQELIEIGQLPGSGMNADGGQTLISPADLNIQYQAEQHAQIQAINAEINAKKCQGFCRASCESYEIITTPEISCTNNQKCCETECFYHSGTCSASCGSDKQKLSYKCPPAFSACCGNSIGMQVEESKPIMYNPEVSIPGFITEEVTGALLGKFLKAFFKYLIYLSGVFTVIIVIIGGFQWVLAGGNQSKISGAKERIKNALIGLTLVSCSYLILNTINPALIEIRVLNIKPIEGAGFQDYDVPERGENCGEEVIENNGNFTLDTTNKNISIYSYNKNFFNINSNNKPVNLFFAKAQAAQMCSINGCPIRTPVYSYCYPSHILESGLRLRYQVAGPCHCACFISGSLMRAGCGTSALTSVSALKAELERNTTNWTKYTGYNAQIYYPRSGDIITITGHVAMVLTTDREHGVVWIVHSTPINSDSFSWLGTSYNGCSERSEICRNTWHASSLDGRGSRDWAGGVCVSNQAVLITRDSLWGQPGYTIYRNKYNSWGTFKDVQQSGSYRSRQAELRFISEHGNPNFNTGAYSIIYNKSNTNTNQSFIGPG